MYSTVGRMGPEPSARICEDSSATVCAAAFWIAECILRRAANGSLRSAPLHHCVSCVVTAHRSVKRHTHLSSVSRQTSIAVGMRAHAQTSGGNRRRGRKRQVGLPPCVRLRGIFGRLDLYPGGRVPARKRRGLASLQFWYGVCCQPVRDRRVPPGVVPLRPHAERSGIDAWRLLACLVAVLAVMRVFLKYSICFAGSGFMFAHGSHI